MKNEMELMVLNSNFESIYIMDTYESIIWTDRYASYGDFEIYTPANKQILEVCKQDNYLWFKDSDHVMIIESIQRDSYIDSGRHLTITGRSLESLLSRRIVWTQTVVTGNVQTCIKKLLNENVISPVIPGRAISNFIFEDSTDVAITSLPNMTAQYTGDNIYDVICDLCSYFDMGFKISLNAQNQFVFKLYSGKDRSYSQLINPYVVFSPNFENIIDSNYLESKKTLRNVTLVAGEGEGSARKTTILGITSGIERRELFTDARDISSNVNGVIISDAEYTTQLQQRGYEKLADYKTTKTFEGQVEATQMFSYGKDFFLGDIVQIEDGDGIESKSRVDEIVRSHNKEGYNIYPTFTILKEE